MAITKEEFVGTKILNEVQSSNIVRTEFDTESKLMIVEFKNGVRYIYNGVPHNVYTKFRLAESQGKFFTAEISKKFKYAKLG